MILRYFIFIMLNISFGLAYANNYKTINVCSEAGFAPYEMKTRFGKWGGYEISLIAKFAKETKRTANFIDMRFDQLIIGLNQKRECDIIVSAIGIDPEREKLISFSTPIYESGYAGVVRSSRVNKFDTLNKLKSDKVIFAFENNTEAKEYVQKTFDPKKVLSFDDNISPIKSILSKKADVYIDDNVYLAVAVKKSAGKLALIPDNILPDNKLSGIGFGFRKTDMNLRDEFNTFFGKIQKNGELKEIQKYYFEDMSWIKEFP